MIQSDSEGDSAQHDQSFLEPKRGCCRCPRADDGLVSAGAAGRLGKTCKDGRTVFNIAGNKYRIVVWINYPYRVVYVRFIGTHRQYDAIDAQNV
jgi:mRNA interferase HigB